MNMIAEYLTLAEVAEKLGVSRQRVRVLCQTYGVEMIAVHPRLSVVHRDEVKKIPSARQRRLRMSPRHRQ